MSKLEKELFELLDTIEIITTCDATAALVATRFDIAEEYGYTIEFDPEPLTLH